MKKYICGEYTAEVVNAAGVQGYLIYSGNGEPPVFRVYDDGDFTDYVIQHHDLAITISEDELASFYKVNDVYILDHSPQVLGLSEAE